MLRLRRRLVLFSLAVLALILASGCGARVEQTIELNDDGSGKIVVVGVDEVRDIEENVKGGLEAAKKALDEKVPSNWHIEVTSKDGTATFRVTTTFRDAAELQERLKEVTGRADVATFTTERTPFYQRRDIQVTAAYEAWAKWAQEALSSLTTQSVIESTRTYVQWPGLERQAVNGKAADEQRTPVESLVIALTWTPGGMTRAVELRPTDGEQLFQPVNEWVQQTASTASVKESGGTYEISFSDSGTPWGTTVKVTQKRHSLFWDQVTVQDPPALVQKWLGPKVEVKSISYRFSGSGWWSTVNQGPPAWYRWPIHSSAVLVDRTAPMDTMLVGYIPRTPLYIAWAIAPLLIGVFAVGVPIGINRTRKHWPRWAAALRGGLRMVTNDQPKFCSNCGQRLQTGEPCACGEVAASAGPRMQATDAPPIGVWARQAMLRAKAVLLMQHTTADIPLPAAGISMLARALVLALAIHGLVNLLLARALSAIGRAVPLLGIFGGARQTVPAFGWVLLALVVASAAGLLVLYLVSGTSQFPAAIVALSDAQWPVALGAVAAWVLTYIWFPLSIGVFVAGAAWGQATLALGLGRLKLTYQQRIGIQAGIALATALVTMVIVGAGTASMFKSML